MENPKGTEFIDELLAQYVDLSKALLEVGAVQPAMECMVTIRHHDRELADGSGLVDDVLSAVGENGDGAEADDHAPDVKRLLARKRKLDWAWDAHQCVWIEPEPDDSDESNLTLNPGMIAEIRQIVALMHTTQRPEDPETLHRLEGVCDALGIDVLPELPREDSFGVLSLEHRLHNVANDLYKRGHFGEAHALYTCALDLDSELLESLFNRALASTRLENYQTAAADLEAVLEMNDRLAEAHYTLGLVHEYMENWDRAIECYEEALEIDEHYSKARTQLDVARSKRDRAAEAESDGASSRSASRNEGHEIKQFSQYVQHPACSLADVGGCEAAKSKLRLLIAQTRAESREAFESWGAEMSGGILLWGRPGVGKTLMARAVAGEINCPFIAVPGGRIVSMWAGETERTLTNLWEEAGKHEAAVIYLPELDSLAPKRSNLSNSGHERWVNRMVGCLLDLMDGLKGRQSGTVVLADTNRPDNMDPALLRAGRFAAVEVRAPANVREWAEVWLIHLDQAERKATRTDVMDSELREALLAERETWLEEHCAERPSNHPIVGFCEWSAERQFTPADVAAIVRGVINERAMMLVDHNMNLGPVTAADIDRHIETYERFVPPTSEAGRSESPEGPGWIE